jgi:hypothetical protein
MSGNANVLPYVATSRGSPAVHDSRIALVVQIKRDVSYFKRAVAQNERAKDVLVRELLLLICSIPYSRAAQLVLG